MCNAFCAGTLQPIHLSCNITSYHHHRSTLKLTLEIDVRNQLDKYTAPETVDWHLACINNRWTKRALVSAGFGYPSEHDGNHNRRWKPIFSVAEIGGDDSAAELAETIEKDQLDRQRTVELEASRSRDNKDDDIHHISGSSSADDITKSRFTSRVAAVHGLNRPFFHIDLVGALHSAIANIETRKLYEEKGGSGIGQLP